MSVSNATSHKFSDKETYAREILFYEGYAKVEPLSISELNEFFITTEPQVTEIKMDKGWCYVSCSSIADDTDEGLFVGFDGEMTKLHNMPAYEAGHLMIRPTHRLTYTISCILNERDRLPHPDFVADEGDDDNGVLSKFKVGGTNRDESSTSKVVKKAQKK
ncbi:hypothetical protein Bca101_010099 [Brassica carinata]